MFLHQKDHHTSSDILRLVKKRRSCTPQCAFACLGGSTQQGNFFPCRSRESSPRPSPRARPHVPCSSPTQGHRWKSPVHAGWGFNRLFLLPKTVPKIFKRKFPKIYLRLLKNMHLFSTLWSCFNFGFVRFTLMNHPQAGEGSQDHGGGNDGEFHPSCGE